MKNIKTFQLFESASTARAYLLGLLKTDRRLLTEISRAQQMLGKDESPEVADAAILKEWIDGLSEDELSDIASEEKLKN